MAKLKKSQILMLTLLALLIFVTPLISSSLRPKYLYFVINILILVLGAEAGLLSSFSKPLEVDHKKQAAAGTAVPVTTKPAVPAAAEASSSPAVTSSSVGKIKVVEKSASEKIHPSNFSVNNNNKVDVERVKKCPSMPSLFFIGGEDTEEAVEEENRQEEDDQYHYLGAAHEEVGGANISGQELFTKAENFIGNFYKQLKMQREESWKRIHGFYHRAF